MRMLKKFSLKEIWKKASLTKKVAVLVVLVLLMFFAFVFAAQAFFFSKIYVYQKETALRSAIETLAETYPDLENDDEIRQCLTEVSNTSSSNIMILNSEKDIIYSLSYRMTVTDAGGDSVRIILDELTRDRKVQSLNLKNGANVTVEYMYFDDERSNTYFPVKMKNQNGEIRANHMAGRLNKQRAVKSITGKISNLSLPLKNNNFRRVDAIRALFLWTHDEKAIESFDETGEFYGVFEEPELHARTMILAKKGDNNDIFFGVVPLANQDETSRLFTNMTLPWLVLSVFLALVVAMIFSKQITRPIRSISRVTTKMKNLDFSEKCSLKTEDELGMLADNINDMSKKLDETIEELLAANEKLKADIEKDRIIEQQRKEFVAAVSHELKTPLAIIRAYTEGLMDGVSRKNSEKYMNVIIRETEKMDSLILSMLENSRLEAGVEELILKKHDLNALVKNVCRIFEEGSSAKFSYKLQNEPVLCEFDMDKIEQVINNFISNAMKHTPGDGTIYIEVKTENGVCTVSVENEGKNISEEELNRVWDRFYKSDKSRDRSDGSTGLGLSIAKNILRLHSADYFVENTERGVKFGFSLKTV